VEFRDVMLMDDGGELRLGRPLIEGARVVAEVIGQGRDAKIRVFKYKSKTRYRRRRGHRQTYTRVTIREILADGHQTTETTGKPAPRPRRRSSVETKAEATAESAPISEGAPSLTPTEAHIEEPAKRPRAAHARKPDETASGSERERDAGADTKPPRRARRKKGESGE
jgi:large subunit ribosomal protein L21